MPLQVTYFNQDFPEGKLFSISGLGSFPNGVTVELTTEQEESFHKRRNTTVAQAFKNSGNVTLKGTSNYRP